MVHEHKWVHNMYVVYVMALEVVFSNMAVADIPPATMAIFGIFLKFNQG